MECCSARWELGYVRGCHTVVEVSDAPCEEHHIGRPHLRNPGRVVKATLSAGWRASESRVTHSWHCERIRSCDPLLCMPVRMVRSLSVSGHYPNSLTSPMCQELIVASKLIYRKPQWIFHVICSRRSPREFISLDALPGIPLLSTISQAAHRPVHLANAAERGALSRRMRAKWRSQWLLSISTAVREMVSGQRDAAWSSRPLAQHLGRRGDHRGSHPTEKIHGRIAICCPGPRDPFMV